MRTDAAAVTRRGAGDDQGAGQILAVGDPDFAVIEQGAFALAGGEQLVLDRVVDDRLDRLAVFHQCDGHAVMRNAVQEIGSAVQRIDH